MHPEIRQIGPGSCPKCGMTLEPLIPATWEDDSEIRTLRLRLVVAVALAAPVLFIAMTPHLFHSMLTPTTELGPSDYRGAPERPCGPLGGGRLLPARMARRDRAVA